MTKRSRRMAGTALTALVVLAVVAAVSFSSLAPGGSSAAEVSAQRSLNGSANNEEHREWGRANTSYPRLTEPHYADGVGQMVSGPSARYISNRIFNDTAQNLFSENGVTQWGFAWGQFLDHTFGLRAEVGGESDPIPFDAADPLESFRNDLNEISFTRTKAAPASRSGVRDQLNTISGYIDASNIYGDDQNRLEWMRQGPVDGDLANNSAKLWLPDGMLPRAVGRDGAPAPQMGEFGRLLATSELAMVSGDVRANENIGLAATHTLFAREHNRIVDALPGDLSEEEKFRIARRVVGAELQHITYTEFLPTLGVDLKDFAGYDPDVNPGITNEFATVGFRGHSMIHGELEPSVPDGTYTDEQLAAFQAQGIEVEHEDGATTLVIPLGLAFGNPDLLAQVGVGPVLKALGAEPQYKNDEQIDNQLRSVLFQIPKPDAADPSECMDGKMLPDCYSVVADLGARDVERTRDHGMPMYNDMRQAYGLPPVSSFTDITGEATEELPPGLSIDDPAILDFVTLLDADGNEIVLGSPEADADALVGVRRTTLAARLKAIYGDVDKVDSFVGMVSEKHRPGTEFGELQLAMWKRQFEALRDGDRFFYRADPELAVIEEKYGISARHTLAEVIEANTDVDVQPDVFKVADEE